MKKVVRKPTTENFFLAIGVQGGRYIPTRGCDQFPS